MIRFRDDQKAIVFPIDIRRNNREPILDRHVVRLPVEVVDIAPVTKHVTFNGSQLDKGVRASACATGVGLQDAVSGLGADHLSRKQLPDWTPRRNAVLTTFNVSGFEQSDDHQAWQLPIPGRILASVP